MTEAVRRDCPGGDVGMLEQSGADGDVQVSYNERIAMIKMNLGENRVNDNFVEKVSAALDTVLGNPEVKVLVTTGTGAFYSSGMDINWMIQITKSDPEILTVHRESFLLLFLRFLTCPLPTVALVNGDAFSTGAMLALAHDHIIMHKSDSVMCLNESALTIRFHPCIMEFFKTKLPNAQTLHESVLLQRRYDGDEAKSAGIVQESCSRDDMYHYALTWVEKVVPKDGFKRHYLRTLKEDLYCNVLSLKQADFKLFEEQLHE